MPRNPLLERIEWLVQRDDFRHNPPRALFRRVVWRLRWKLYPDKPWLLYAHGTFPLLTLRCEPGRYIYLQGAWEPYTADFVKRVLKPGMVFVDVGAHLGEYAILASELVKPLGSVHAFEPRPDIFCILQANLALNQSLDVVARPEAVWDELGFADFELTPEPSRSALQSETDERQRADVIRVPTLTLDHYFSRFHVSQPTLIKIDVEGAELHVLKGAQGLLARPPEEAPLIIFEYQPGNTQRFGHTPEEIVNFLCEFGYTIYDNRRGKLVPWDKNLEISLEHNLIASKGHLPAFFESDR